MRGRSGDVEVIFARGSGELPGLGIVGRPFFRALRANLRDARATAYAVDYAAHWNQGAVGAGATNLVERLVMRAKEEPHLRFVLGGYSQGAMVVHLALGGSLWGRLVARGSYKTIPPALAPRVSAVVLFGNPLARYGARIPAAYADRTQQFCNPGDPVCTRGRNYLAHLRYGGSAREAAAFSAARV
jgi:cutinase